MGTICISCNHEREDVVTDPMAACPDCGKIYSKMAVAKRNRAERQIVLEKSAARRIQARFAVYGGIIVLLVVFFGNLHVISGSHIGFPTVALKPSFTFSETFINTDTITGLPYIAAVSRYPISVQTLQRIGFIETDVQRQARIQRDVERKWGRRMKQYSKDSEAEYNRLLRKHGLK